jgi:hypothetical protein
MSTRTSRTNKSKSRVETASFAAGCFVEIIDHGTSPAARTHLKNTTNGKLANSQGARTTDRRYLKEIEILLNNCVNLAHRLESKKGIEILKKLQDVRSRATTLRAKSS